MFRRAAVLLASSALAVSASTVPAMAGEKKDFYDLKLTVCKKVIGKDHGKKDRGQEFLIKIHTDQGGTEVRLKDKECKDVKLEFDKPKVHIYEKDQKGYKVHKFEVPMGNHWDTEGYKVKGDNKVVIKYRDCDKAKVKVVVVNKKDKKDDCGC